MKVNEKIKELEREGKSWDFITGFLEGALYSAEEAERRLIQTNTLTSASKKQGE